MIINNNFIFAFLFLIGLYLFGMITWLEGNLPEKFIISTIFWLSLRILLIISTIFMILPISFLLCNKSCIGTLTSITKHTNIIYFITLFILGGIMIVCGTIIKGEIDADINKPAWGIIGMGVSLLIISIGLGWNLYKDKNISAEEAKTAADAAKTAADAAAKTAADAAAKTAEVAEAMSQLKLKKAMDEVNKINKKYKEDQEEAQEELDFQKAREKKERREERKRALSPTI